LSLGGSHGAAPNDYQPSGNSAPVEEDDDEDMGFGNTSLSRGKTPRPAAPAGAGKAVETKADTKKTPVEDKKGDLEKRKLGHLCECDEADIQRHPRVDGLAAGSARKRVKHPDPSGQSLETKAL